MKRLIIIFLLAFAASASAQTIRVNVTGNDPVTGKKVKADLIYATFNSDGSLSRIGYMVRYFETDNTTPAAAAGTSERQKKAVESFEKTFEVGSKSMLSTTKIYNPLFDDQEPPVAIPNAILISEYLKAKAINTYPGVANADSLSKLIEGILKEVIAIQLANGEIL